MIQNASTLRCFSLSVSGQCPLILSLCIVLMFLLSRAIGRGDLRSAGISCFTAKPFRYYRSPSLAPESFGRLLLRWRTILGYYPIDPGCFTKDLGGPVLAWYSIVVVKLDAVCDLGLSVGTRLKRIFRFACAYYQGIGALSQNSVFSGLWVRFRAYTLHLA